jgi:hypothetical protein
VLKGIGFPGNAYNTGRWRELAYLIAITKAFNLPIIRQAGNIDAIEPRRQRFSDRET